MKIINWITWDGLAVKRECILVFMQQSWCDWQENRKTNKMSQEIPFSPLEFVVNTQLFSFTAFALLILPVWMHLSHLFFFFVYSAPTFSNLMSEVEEIKVTNFGHESDLISMCQRCSSSLCLFSTAFCFCFFSLLSCSFLARLLGLISTGSSGLTFF